MHNDNIILKVENLTVGYGDHAVLTDVSFDLGKGEILVILGQNGSGKSTLLKTLIGLLPKKAGNIWLKSNNESQIQSHQLVKKGISYFTQGGLVIPSLTVREHLELASMKAGRKLGKTAFEVTFDEFPKLEEMQNQRAGNLSGGERQMLSFGILLMQGTDTWLLDEPTAGLAPALVQFTADFLYRKNSEGVTILLVEHNMEVAFNLATNIAVTKEGRLTGKFAEDTFKQKDFLNKYIYN